jgi:hypothetical protein
MKKKILILCYSDLQRDPRIRRHVEALQQDYELLTCGYAPITDKNIDFIQSSHRADEPVELTFHLQYPTILRKIISLLIKLFSLKKILQKNLKEIERKKEKFILDKELDTTNAYDLRYWTELDYGNRLRTLLELCKQDFDLILTNDLQTLPLALKLAKDKNVKVVYDAHEYTPLEGEGIPEWVAKYQDYYTYLCKKYLPQTETMFTVCEGIAEEYHKNFGVKPLVLTNATAFYDLKPQLIAANKVRIIHHGIAGAARRLDLLIEMMDYLDERFTLDLMLMNNHPDYIEELKQMAKNNKRINFIEPVETKNIPLFTNQYDIGVIMIPPTNLNYKYGLGNKYFEFIQARLMIAIGPLPEMQKITEKYDLGVVSEDFYAKTLASKLNTLTNEQIMHHKQQADKYAYELSAENNKTMILNVVKNIFSKIKL